MLGGARTDASITAVSLQPAFARVLSIPEIKKRYEVHATRLLRDACSAERIVDDIETCRNTIAAAVAEERTRSEAVTKAPEDPGARARFRSSRARAGARSENAIITMLRYVEDRVEHVREQLAGRIAGRGAASRFAFRAADPSTSRLQRLVVRSESFELAATDELDASALRARTRALFKAIDTNASGVLERCEVEAEFRRQDATRGRWLRMRGSGGLPADVARRQAFLALDRDEDRSVDAREFEAVLRKALDALDRNKDGRWTRRELARATR